MVLTAAEKSMKYLLNSWTAPGRVDTERGQQVLGLKAHMATLEPQAKKTFISDWFHRCGAKGDLSGFLEASLETRTKTSSTSSMGMLTPAEVGTLLGLRLEYYEMNIHLFKEALKAEISDNQAQHELPMTNWEELEGDFFSSRHAYRREKVSKRGEIQAGRVLTAQGGQELAMEMGGSAPVTEGRAPADSAKAEAAQQKKVAKASRLMAQLTKLLEATSASLIRMKLKKQNDDLVKDGSKLLQKAETLVMSTDVNTCENVDEVVDELNSHIQ
eukprot:2171905-Amphidinium_carterae.1